MEEDKEDMTVPFDEGSQVMHVVSRHAAFAYAGTLLRGVPGDRAIEGTINDAWNTVMPVADVGKEVLMCCKLAGRIAEVLLISTGTNRAA